MSGFDDLLRRNDSTASSASLFVAKHTNACPVPSRLAFDHDDDDDDDGDDGDGDDANDDDDHDDEVECRYEHSIAKEDENNGWRDKLDECVCMVSSVHHTITDE
mmetsp:Transcript_22776/g.44337  ORF Transcript_22776/g.44337 Transcript_22776/m.44337 type:complete len:104 (-) Transcript_22776:449-760(-)